MNVKERIAYVRGLVEGSESSGQDEKVQLIWTEVLNICDSLADSVAALWESVDDVEEYLEALDLDLADLEDIAEGEADQVFVEVECQNCGEEVYFEEDLLADDDVEILCPACGAELSVDSGYALADSRSGAARDLEETVTHE